MKKYITLFLLVLFTVSFSTDRDIIIRNYSALAACLDIADANTTTHYTYIIEDTCTFTENRTIPKNVELKHDRLGLLDAGGYDVIIKGYINVGNFQLFDSTYSDTSFTIKNNTLNPIWFGADRYGTVSSYRPLQNCLDALLPTTFAIWEEGSGGKIFIPNGYYTINDTLFYLSDYELVIEGENPSDWVYNAVHADTSKWGSVIVNKAEENVMFKIGGSNSSNQSTATYGMQKTVFRNIALANDAAVADTLTGIYTVTQHQFSLENVSFNDFEPRGIAWEFEGAHQVVSFEDVYFRFVWRCCMPSDVTVVANHLTGGVIRDCEWMHKDQLTDAQFIQLNAFGRMVIDNIYVTSSANTTGWFAIIDSSQYNHINNINFEGGTEMNFVKLTNEASQNYFNENIISESGISYKFEQGSNNNHIKFNRSSSDTVFWALDSSYANYGYFNNIANASTRTVDASDYTGFIDAFNADIQSATAVDGDRIGIGRKASGVNIHFGNDVKVDSTFTAMDKVYIDGTTHYLEVISDTLCAIVGTDTTRINPAR